MSSPTPNQEAMLTIATELDDGNLNTPHSIYEVFGHWLDYHGLVPTPASAMAFVDAYSTLSETDYRDEWHAEASWHDNMPRWPSEGDDYFTFETNEGETVVLRLRPLPAQVIRERGRIG